MEYNFLLESIENFINRDHRQANKCIMNYFKSIKQLEDPLLPYRLRIEKIEECKRFLEKYLTFLSKIQKELFEKKVRKLSVDNENAPAQRTEGWFEQRKTMLTASRDIYGAIGTKKYTSETMNYTIKHKLGKNPKFKGNLYTQHGNKYEQIGIQIYSTRYEKIVEFLK